MVKTLEKPDVPPSQTDISSTEPVEPLAVVESFPVVPNTAQLSPSSVTLADDRPPLGRGLSANRV